ncbi:MAG: hypothetical protein JXR77_13035 [Lentisphaeria bacterium]|nr:hypothetical protein [Lentisphaeria bacterium]
MRMRSAVGLIVGVALGILLTYFAVSAFRVKGLAERRTLSTGAPRGCPTPAATGVPEPGCLGREAGRIVREATDNEGGMVACLGSGGPDVASAALAAGFVEGFGAGHRDRVACPRTVADVLALDSLRAVFCADHGDLAGLLEEAERTSRPLPPVYTAGLSQRLIEVCATPGCAVTGVVLFDPGTVLRIVHHDPTAWGTDGSAPREIPVVVLEPAAVLRLGETVGMLPAPRRNTPTEGE